MATSPSFRKSWVWAHWIVGITAGLVLALVGVTGAIMAFESQLLNAMNGDARSVEPGHERIPVPVLLQRIEQQESGSVVTSFLLPDDPRAAARVTLSGEVRYIDPYTGVWQQASGTRGEEFFKATRALHRWLLLEGAGREAGRQIVGACTVLLIGLALSGLYLRWPRKVSDWREWLVVRSRLRGRAFLWSLHSVVGTYALIPYLFLALTGLFWSYEWYREALYNIAGVERRQESTDQTPARPSPAVLSDAWSVFQAQAQQAGVVTLLLIIPSTADRPIELRYLAADAPHTRAFSMMEFDAASGTLLRHERYADKPLGGKIMWSMFALHTGSFFGVGGSAALMLASLALPLFAVTGWLMYLRRRRPRSP